MASCVGIAVSVVTAGAATGLGVAIIAGAAGGAASALVGAILNGSNIGQIAKSTLPVVSLNDFLSISCVRGRWKDCREATSFMA